MIEVNNLQNTPRSVMGDDGAEYSVIVNPGKSIRVFGISNKGESFNTEYRMGDPARYNIGQTARSRGPIVKITARTVTVQDGPDSPWGNNNKRLNFYQFAVANALGERINTSKRW